jgi:hypothetical protein
MIIQGGLAAMLVLGAGAACSDSTDPADQDDFSATLTGAAERPNPVTTTATGSATVEIDDSDQTLTVTVNVTNLVSTISAHIHVGDSNTAGPISVTLLATPLAIGSFTGKIVDNEVFTAADVSGGETFATLVAKIRSGNAYINVHTVANPGGEIRGQLVAQ